MAEMESARAPLPARYQDLKLALLSQLDRAEDSFEYLHGLRQAVKEWHGAARDPAVPAGVHYLLGRHPPAPGIDTKGVATAAVIKQLREVARLEDIEVFITVLEFGPGEDARLVHMADRHENDIHEYFAPDKQEILQTSMAFLEVSKYFEACLPPTQKRVVGVAILPTSRVLDRKGSNPGQTEHDRRRLQESMMCYLADRVLDKYDVVAASLVLVEHADSLAAPDHDNPTPFQWPRKPLEKTLWNSILVDPSSFATRAAFVWYEPPLQFFEGVAQRLRFHSLRVLDYETICRGLDILLGRVELPNLLPVLDCLKDLKLDMTDPEETSYVDEWLHGSFIGSRCEAGVWFHREDAAIFVDIYRSFLDVELDDMICNLMHAQMENAAFCFALIAKLIEASSDRWFGTDSLPACWTLFEESFLKPLSVRDMVHGCSKKALPRFPKASSWNDRALPSQPMDPAIPTMVGDIQSRLSQDLTGWQRTAARGFLAWLEIRVYKEGADAEEFTAFWLPLLRDLALRHDRAFWEAELQYGRPWYTKFFRLVLLRYLIAGVGREPPRRDFRRPSFSTLETDGCASCRVLGRFLLDRSRVRAIFPVVLLENTPPATSASSSSASASRARAPGYVLRQAALAHILPLLAARRRNCAFHLKDSTCGGTVLCVEKRDGSKQWENWCGRRDEAAREMAGFDQGVLRLILGAGDYKGLVGMEICKRGNREEWDRMLEGLRRDDEANKLTHRRSQDDLGGDMRAMFEWRDEEFGSPGPGDDALFW